MTFHSENHCEHCENSKLYGTLIMKCPNCFWHDYYKICPICDHQIPEERNYIKDERAFTIVEQLHTKRGERRRGLLNFSFLSNRCVFDSFCHWSSIKFLKRYLVSGFIVSVY